MTSSQTRARLGSLSPRKEAVRIFYEEMWDKADLSLIPKLSHRDFTFRGSLGPVLIGHEQFGQYVSWLTSNLRSYTSDIDLLVEEGDVVSGQLRFHGYHDGGLFFGQPPRGQHVAWSGTPFFTFKGDLIQDLWVLGDIYGVLGQLGVHLPAPGFALIS